MARQGVWRYVALREIGVLGLCLWELQVFIISTVPVVYHGDSIENEHCDTYDQVSCSLRRAVVWPLLKHSATMIENRTCDIFRQFASISDKFSHFPLQLTF